LNRSNDQLFTIHFIGELAKDESNFLNGIVDASSAAVVGYSMGGYGALITAGAGLRHQAFAATLWCEVFCRLDCRIFPIPDF